MNGNILFHYKFPNNDPVPLIIPNPESTDFQLRIRDAVRTLEAIENKSGEELIESINNVNKDVWKVRIAKGSHINSLGMEALEIVLSRLKKIISYTASAEQEARPYYFKPLSLGIDYSKMCRVGQTFRGSYGITIEAPITDMSLSDTYAPLGRRVTERIFKSLKLIETEREFEDIESIYEDSINGNICLALIDLLKISEGDIEYSANLSPLYKASDIMIDNPTVSLKNANIPYLEELYDKLHSEVELIENVTIQGIIIELKHEFQESGDDSDYNIIISGSHDGLNEHAYHLTLKKEDYIKACHIHTQSIENKKETVEITGNARRTRKKWYIDSYTNFVEIGDVRAHNAKKDKLQAELGMYSPE
jgi:hypothetical protein